MNNNTTSKNQALQKFKTNFWGVSCLVFIALVAIAGISAYTWIPDASQNANQMALNIQLQSPGFQSQVIEVPNPNPSKKWSSYISGQENPNEIYPISSYRFANDSLYYIPYNQEGKTDLLEKVIPTNKFPTHQKKEIEKNYIYIKTYYLGTDRYGRDLLSRLILGIRISLSIGFIAVFISLVIGITLGAIGGYFGGKIDALIMWLINVTWSIPTLLLVIAITLALGKGFYQVFIAVGLTMWVEVARIVRGQVISVKEMQYVTAARALGFKDGRIIFKHILPNILAPVIVISAANFAAAILVESGLSFLGIGAQPPTPSWGTMIKDHYAYISLGKPFLAIIPGLAIMLSVMAFMLIGNALRDALDVKSE
ncbi:MAG: ABC transporter permease [Flavobacteriaceae bacterium]|nr:ABC transporter permease [Flavobacteriaceae bacterium]